MPEVEAAPARFGEPDHPLTAWVDRRPHSAAEVTELLQLLVAEVGGGFDIDTPLADYKRDGSPVLLPPFVNDTLVTIVGHDPAEEPGSPEWDQTEARIQEQLAAADAAVTAAAEAWDAQAKNALEGLQTALDAGVKAVGVEVVDATLVAVLVNAGTLAQDAAEAKHQAIRARRAAKGAPPPEPPMAALLGRIDALEKATGIA